MTEKKFIGYSVEDLLHDQEFVSKIKRIETNEEWEKFLLSNIESKNNIIQARKIIGLFKTNEGVLPGEKKYKLWENISRFNTEFSRKYKLAGIKTFIKVAASVLLVISLGSLLYLQFHLRENHFRFSETRNGINYENPLLVLSNGNKVELERTESKIIVLKDQEAIQINNDSIVENQASLDNKTNKSKLIEVIIPYGKKSELILEDGTKVWLNAGTRIAFPQKFEGKNREVYLEGEAYFEVVKNVDQPFIISTNSVDLKVLGTKFNVLSYDSDDFCEAVLLEGSIQIWGKNKLFKDKIIMTPNQKATYSKVEKDIILSQEPAPENYTTWKDGWYQFTNEGLEHVLKKLERYYNVSFDYNQAVISKGLPVSGKLDLKDSLNEVLVVLSRVAKFDYQISGSRIIIKK